MLPLRRPVQQPLRARNGVALAFVLNGFTFASWVSRIPETRARLGLDPGGLGILLLCLSIGSLVALPLSGRAVERLGPARVVRLGLVATVAGLATVAVAVPGPGWVALTGAGLVLSGLGVALWDVAMNVAAAQVERALGRTVMPRFHAGFSIGTVAGAGVGALTIALGVSMTVHLLVVAAAVTVLGLRSTPGFLAGEAPRGPRVSAWGAWRERRTLVLGLLVLSLALTEGTANDWLAVALQDGYHVSESLAVLGYGLFVASMTVGRLLGPGLLDRFGRAGPLWATMACAGLGLLLLVLGATPWLVVPGIALWGIGASLGFPVGMSAGADDPAYAAARVSVISTIGYTAFLAGPPLVGLLGDRFGTLDALLVVAVVLVPSSLAVPAARAPRSAAETSPVAGPTR